MAPKASIFAPIPDTERDPSLDSFQIPDENVPPLTPMRVPGTHAPDALDQNITNDAQQLQKIRFAQSHPWGTPENHPGKLGKTAHVFATLGNIAGDVFAPGVMENIPGTWLNMQQQEHGLAGRLNKEQEEQATNRQREATAEHEEEQTRQEPEDAEARRRLENAQAGEAEAKAANGPDMAQAYAHAVQSALSAGRDPSTDPVVQHLADAISAIQKQPNTPPGTKTVQLEVGGKPHQVLVDERTGKQIRDLGESGEKPPVINTGNQEFQEAERGRGLLDKAEGNFRTAQQGANALRDMIGSAESGNKVSAQVLPLQGALEITTAQGVHRINRTEVEQYGGAGNLWDKVAGELGKIGQGQPIPRNILEDMRKLADLEERAAFQNYKGAFDSAVKRYGLKNEQPLEGPKEPAANEPKRPANVPAGYQYDAHGPKGAGWYAPTEK